MQKVNEIQTDLMALVGSNLYGYATPESDTDYRGFVVEPGDCHLPLRQFNTIAREEPDDLTVWGWNKFYSLLCQGNPNVAELLFVPEESIVNITPLGRKLLDNRDKFIHRGFLKAIAGYGVAEWRRARGVKRVETKDGHAEVHNPAVVATHRRTSLEEVGYSVKNAAHAIRILEQGCELAETGKITFPRHNADYFLSIRRFEVSFDEVERRYQEADARLRELQDQETLPEREPERTRDFYYEMIEDSLKRFCQDQYGWQV